MLPRFSVLLTDWQPLQQPQNADMLGTFAAWRPLLESDAQRDDIFQVRCLGCCSHPLPHTAVNTVKVLVAAAPVSSLPKQSTAKCMPQSFPAHLS